MTQYCKLCRYIFDWVKKPLAGICIAMLACDFIWVAAFAEGSVSYAEVLDCPPMVLVSGGALVLFAGITRQRLHRLWGKHRGIYTVIALPAPGWAFPAAAYTVSAAGTLALISLQIAALAAFYPMFWVFSGVGEGLYLAFLRSAMMAWFLPRTLLGAEQTVTLFGILVAFPFSYSGDFKKASFAQADHQRRVSDEVFAGLLVVVWIFVMVSGDKYRTVKAGVFAVLVISAIVLTIRDSRRGLYIEEKADKNG